MASHGCVYSAVVESCMIRCSTRLCCVLCGCFLRRSRCDVGIPSTTSGRVALSLGAGCVVLRCTLKASVPFFLDARLMSARDRVQKLQQRDPGACYI